MPATSRSTTSACSNRLSYMAPVEIDRYAELLVRVGVNLEAGQELFVDAFVEHAPLARAVARAGYRAGARRVDVAYVDKFVDAALVEHAPEEEIERGSPWLIQRATAIEDRGAALVSFSGDPAPRLFDDLDPRRVAIPRAKDLMAERIRVALGERVRWTIASYPTEGWAERALGTPDVERLWQAISTTVRLDEDDPTAAWLEHVEQ